MKILITGASGFVGRCLCEHLTKRGHLVTASVRSNETPTIENISSSIVVGDLGPDTDWTKALVNQEAVIHLAARTHVMNESTSNPEAEYLHVNVESTKRLIHQMSEQNVSRFIFMSSVKVNGEQTTVLPYSESQPSHAEDAYGRTKLQTELLISNSPDLKSTIIRSPLVYGPGVKGNFLKLIQLSERGLPLPIGMIKNKRSLIFLENLIDAVIQSLENSAAIGQIYLVSDNADISTPELFRAVAKALNKPSRLIPFPVFLLRLAGVLFGKSGAIKRLAGSLQVDCNKIHKELGWKPPFSLQQGLDKTVIWYQNQSKQ
jgi:nucleoside-diphosphate-sugar epimerase